MGAGGKWRLSQVGFQTAFLGLAVISGFWEGLMRADPGHTPHCSGTTAGPKELAFRVSVLRHGPEYRRGGQKENPLSALVPSGQRTSLGLGSGAQQEACP